MNNGNTAQHALVLTGTGASAAYEVGVMKALLRENWGEPGHPPIDPYCFSGSSVGAFNAAAMVSRTDRGLHTALEELENVWLDKIAVRSASGATGFFRLRAEPTQYFKLNSYAANPLKPFLEMGLDFFHFTRQTMQRVAYAMSTAGTLPDGAVQVTELNEWLDISPLVDLVHESIQTANIAVAGKKLRVTTVNWQTGAPRTFQNQDVGRADGHQVILAAVALPGVVPPQIVEGVPHVDAAVLMDTPLKPAIRARSMDTSSPVVLHVVYVDASVTDIPIPPISNTFSTVYRLYMLALSRLVNADLARADALNERIRTKQLLESVAAASNEGQEDAIKARLGPEAAYFWRELNHDTADKATLTVHRYRPLKNVHGFEDLDEVFFDTAEVRRASRREPTTATYHDGYGNAPHQRSRIRARSLCRTGKGRGRYRSDRGAEPSPRGDD